MTLRLRSGTGDLIQEGELFGGGKAGKRPLCINLKFSDFRKKDLLPALPPSEKFFVHLIDRSLSGAEGSSSFLANTKYHDKSRSFFKISLHPGTTFSPKFDIFIAELLQGT